MKLTKQNLNRLLKNKFENLGYTYFVGSIEDTDGLYCKKIADDLFLSIGVNRSRLYDDRFTVDMYLGQTTNIYCCWGDIPKSCCTRPGFLLSDKELSTFTEEENITHDLWWKSDDESLRSFFQIFDLAENNILKDEILISKIQESIDSNILFDLSKKIINRVKSENVDYVREYRCIPSKEKDKIPLNWFKAAEEEILESKVCELSKYRVEMASADAYRVFVLDSLLPNM